MKVEGAPHPKHGAGGLAALIVTAPCSLIDAYTRIYPDPQWWQGGPNHRVALDEFMLERPGWPFCDPTRPGAQ